jgi:hypothetical protein
MDTPNAPASCSTPRYGELQVPFGQKGKRLYEPLQVTKGIKCGCVCPGCGDALIAVHAPSGDVTPHFRHKSGSACATGYETALHKAAKQLIADKEQLWFPVVRAEHFEQDALGNPHELRDVLIPAGIDKLTAVRTEQWLSRLRPDILAIGSLQGEVLVEIAVTHKVDHEKRAKVNARGLAMVEFNLGDLRPLNFSTLSEALFQPSNRAHWVHHPRIGARLNGYLAWLQPILADAAHEAAVLAAQNKAFAEAEAEAERLRREKYASDQRRNAENKAAKQALAKAAAAKFKSLMAGEKQLRIESAVKSPMVGWPSVTKVRNKAYAAISEPFALWQGAVYFKFLKPGNASREVHAQEIADWLTTRFHVAEGEPTVRQAVGYFLAVMVNQGLLRKGIFGKHEVMPVGGALPIIEHKTRGPQAGEYVRHRPRIFHWQAPDPTRPRLRSYAEMFCNTKGFSAVKLMPLIGSSETKLINDYASPRQAAVALMRHMGGNEEVWMSFLCGAGIASES